MIMKKLLITSFLLFAAVSHVWAADFLTSARGGGLGLSYFLISNDPSGALYNPSSLGYVKGWQTQFTYEKLNDYEYNIVKEKPYYGHFGVVYHRPQWGTLAFNSVQSGSFSELTNIPTFNHLALSYARQLSADWTVGTSLKYLLETGFGERKAFDFDLGASYRPAYGLVAGVAIENIARSALSPDYLGAKEYLPRRVRIGAGYTLASQTYQGAILASGQMEEWGISEKQTTSLVNVGTEWWFYQNSPFSFATRVGYTFGEALQFDVKNDYSSPSAGLSLDYKFGINDLRLDYTWQAYPFKTIDGSSPSNHFVALTFGWGGVPSFRRAQEPTQPKIQQPKEPAQPKIQQPKVPVQPKIQQPKAPEPAKISQPIEPAKIQQPKAPEPPKILKKPEPIQEPVAPLKDRDTDFEISKFSHFDVEMEVNLLMSMDTKRIVFYVRPKQIVKTANWRLYIFKAKVKSWTDEESIRLAAKIIEGKGVPPINIVWDGTGADGDYVPSGKYYYILTAESVKGEKYATEWFSFKLN
jgi:hypothetical protein